MTRIHRLLLGAALIPLGAASALAQTPPRQRAPGVANLTVSNSYLTSGPYVLTLTLLHADQASMRDSSAQNVTVARSGGALTVQTAGEEFSGDATLDSMAAATNSAGLR
ncbi:MAG: hypothetical protein ACREJ3_17570, partial [Polyangiaceae bacterium]